MTNAGNARVLLKEWERKWLELENAMENDSLSHQKQDLEPGSEGHSLALAELTSRTRNRMLQQLEIMRKLKSVVPERPEDELRPIDVFDDIQYLATEAEKLREQIANEPPDSIRGLLNDVSLKVFWLWIPRWAEEGQTRFSAIIEGIETAENGWTSISVNPNDLRKLLDETLNYGTPEDLERLFQNWMGIDQTDHEGRTALHMCSARGKKEAVMMLVARWANVNAVFMYHGSSPKTVLDAAIECGKQEIAAALLENGAKRGSEIHVP